MLSSNRYMPRGVNDDSEMAGDELQNGKPKTKHIGLKRPTPTKIPFISNTLRQVVCNSLTVKR